MSGELKVFEDVNDAQNFKPVPATNARASTKYDKYGSLSLAVNQMDYNSSTVAGVYGLFIGEAVTNLFTANQSTAGDTNNNTTGLGSGDGATISLESTEFYQGSKCVKVVANAGQGLSVYHNTSGTVTVSAMIKGTAGDTIYISNSGGGVSTPYTLTGDWQYIKDSEVVVSSQRLLIYSTTVGRSITFYVDMLQATQTSYPLSWTLGGTTTSAESMTLQSDLLNIDTGGTVNLLTANQSNIETNTSGWSAKTNSSIVRTTDEKYSGTASLSCTTNGVGAYEGCTQVNSPITAVTGVNYIASGWVKAPLGATMDFLLQDDVASATTSYTGTGEWQYVTAGRVHPASSSHAWITIRTNTTQAITFYADQLQIEPRSSATDWVLGGTQRNSGQGTIEFEAYLNTQMDTANAMQALLHSTGGNNRFSIYWIDSTEKWCVVLKDSTGAYGNYPHNSASLSSGLHRFGVTWKNGELILYIDGVSVHSTVTTHKMPISITNIALGSTTTGVYQINGIIRNVNFSNVVRTPDDVSKRAKECKANGYYKVDTKTSAFGLFHTDNRMYKRVKA